MYTLIKGYRYSNWLYHHNRKWLASKFDVLNYLLLNSQVSGKTLIGAGTVFGYSGIGLVIHQKAIIGKDCVIAQNMTIGSLRPYLLDDSALTIGNQVYIGAGACTLGPVKIGDGAVIGANAVVIHDVPSKGIAVGIPARIIIKF